MEKTKVEEKAKVESVSIVLGSELPSKIKLDEEVGDDDFVELRVERINPAFTKVVKLDSTPGRKFSELIRQSGINFD